MTVSGASPLVDVQNTRQQTTVNRDVMDAIPTGRTPGGYAVLVPGVIAAGSSGLHRRRTSAAGQRSARWFMLVHGSRGQASPLLYDGMRYNNMNGDARRRPCDLGAEQRHRAGVHRRSRLAVDQAESAGVWQNAIPKQGGDTFSGSVFGNFSNETCSRPATCRIRRKRRRLPRNWDFNPAFGGPLKRSKAWIFGSYRNWGVCEHPPGAFPDTRIRSTSSIRRQVRRGGE